MTNDNAITLIDNHFHSDAVLAKFAGILGEPGAKSYIRSVVLAVEADESGNLAQCSLRSLEIAALRAASLELSCDPAVKQAYLVAYKTKNGWRASFQPHYLGLYTLAMRTRRYQHITVIGYDKNYRVETDLMTGDLTIIHTPTDKPALTMGKPHAGESVGWLAWYRTKDGAIKKVHMTNEEIIEHAKRYPSWNNEKSLWHSKNPEHRDTMYMKTCLRELLKWADFSGTAGANLRQAIESTDQAPEDEPDVIDAKAEDVVPEKPKSKGTAKAETIDPLGARAVKFAMDEWNVSEAEARRSIRKAMEDGLIKEPFIKDDFKQMVAGAGVPA